MFQNSVCTLAMVLGVGIAEAQQTFLNVWVEPDQDTAVLGDVVTWTFYAELVNPDPNKVIVATISDMAMTVFHFDTLSQITNNSFQPAFDSDFFGPADDGMVVPVVDGSQIVGASGQNTLMPLNNPGGPDSRNPLPIYSYDTVITDDTERMVQATILLNGQITGAYADPNSPFDDVFFYQLADGSPGTVPIVYPNLISPFLPRLHIIPAPASLSLLSLALLTTRRRR